MSHKLMLCTVGGSPNPIIFSIKNNKPEFVVFVCSNQTLNVIEKITSELKNSGFNLPDSNYEPFPISDHENFSSCVKELYTLLNKCNNWLRRGSDYEICVDFTGGTKCMTAALAIITHRLKCQFCYIGGETRDKNGIGAVIDGNERWLHNYNPWDGYGFAILEDVIPLFNQYDFHYAQKILENGRNNISDIKIKNEFTSLISYISGLNSWDLFKYRDALNQLKKFKDGDNNLQACLKNESIYSNLIKFVQKYIDHLQALSLSEEMFISEQLIIDLLSNANRRLEQGRYDDSAIRSYRAIEALGQLELKKMGLSAKAFPIEKIPDQLKPRYEHRAQNGVIRIGLQEIYRILSAWDNPLGKKFENAGLLSNQSILEIRNNSLLTHGFNPINDEAAKKLIEEAMKLADLSEEDLVKFPKIIKEP